jgi:hypothetical protein
MTDGLVIFLKWAEVRFELLYDTGCEIHRYCYILVETSENSSIPLILYLGSIILDSYS